MQSGLCGDDTKDDDAASVDFGRWQAYCPFFTEGREGSSLPGETAANTTVGNGCGTNAARVL